MKKEKNIFKDKKSKVSTEKIKTKVKKKSSIYTLRETHHQNIGSLVINNER
jgi:hypothetical protein